MSTQVIHSDCMKAMRKMHRQGVQVDMIFTDPPYHLVSIVERFGGANAKAAKSNGPTGKFARESKGFMGKGWDGGDIAFRASTWKLAYKLLKPGGYIIAFAHTKNYHRLATAIEKAGFEVRDMLDWVYGQGTPHGHHVDGFPGHHTALKPAKEPAVLARKPLEGSNAENMALHGVGALNIDALRVPVSGGDDLARWPSNLTHDGSAAVLEHFPAKAGQKSPVIGDEPSRSNANIFNPFSGGRPPSAPLDERGNAGRFFMSLSYSNIDDWCARICYCPKAPNKERVYRCSGCDHRENFVFETCPSCNRRMKPIEDEGAADAEIKNHPTVKPVDLLAYWIRGVCPAGGTILDPFAGTGSTGIAALREGRKAILIDADPDSIADINWRIAHLSGGGTPLFGGGG